MTAQLYTLVLALLLGVAGPAFGGAAYIEETNDSEAKTADHTVLTDKAYLSGFSIRESAGTPAVATVILRNAADTDTGTGGVQCAESGGTTQVGGAAVAYIELAANASLQMDYSHPISLPNGLCADVVAGEVDIQVYVTPSP